MDQILDSGGPDGCSRVYSPRKGNLTRLLPDAAAAAWTILLLVYLGFPNYSPAQQQPQQLPMQQKHEPGKQPPQQVSPHQYVSGIVFEFADRGWDIDHLPSGDNRAAAAADKDRLFGAVPGTELAQTSTFSSLPYGVSGYTLKSAEFDRLMQLFTARGKKSLVRITGFLDLSLDGINPLLINPRRTATKKSRGDKDSSRSVFTLTANPIVDSTGAAAAGASTAAAPVISANLLEYKFESESVTDASVRGGQGSGSKSSAKDVLADSFSGSLVLLDGEVFVTRSYDERMKLTRFLAIRIKSGTPSEKNRQKNEK